MHNQSHVTPKASWGGVGTDIQYDQDDCDQVQAMRSGCLRLIPLGFLLWPNRGWLRLHLREIREAMMFCSGLPVKAAGIKPSLRQNPGYIELVSQGAVPAPWASIQTSSASLPPVRATFYLDGCFRWKGCCIRFYVISSLSRSRAVLPLLFRDIHNSFLPGDFDRM